MRETCVVSKPHLCVERRQGCRGCAPVEFFGVGYGTLHHHASSAETVDLKDAVPCEPLILGSAETCTAISFLQHES